MKSDRDLKELDLKTGHVTGLEMANLLLSIFEECGQSCPHLKLRLEFSGQADESGEATSTQVGAGYVMGLGFRSDCWICSSSLSLALRLLRKIVTENEKE